MDDKTYKQIKNLLMNVVGSVQEMNDDSNLYMDDLQKLTDLIRNAGATKKQMTTMKHLGQCCINDTDDAIFMQAYKDGARFDKYVKSIIKSLKLTKKP